MRSAARVLRLRSRGCGLLVVLLLVADGEGVGVIDVSPWPRASRDSTPAVGKCFKSSAVKVANDRPDEPAP